ncbi:MAG TPA: hypothetical protein VFW73_00885, partial [Lacipirellulaceae bacterium]|nr:hypothetical protein [Lacipirellulaceae bacterium]
TRNRFNVEWGLFQCAIVKGDIAGARGLAAELLWHAEAHPDQPLVDAHLANGMAAFGAGDFEAAAGMFEAAAGLSNPEKDQPHFMTHGQNPGLFSLSYLARTQCFLGSVDRGRRTIDRVLAIAMARSRDAGHIYGQVNAFIHAVRVYHLCGDLKAERRMAHEAQEISRRNQFAYYEATSACHLGWVAGVEGDLTGGIEQMIDGMAALSQTGTSYAVLGFYVLLSQLYVRAGAFDEAEQSLQMAVGSRGLAVWSAEIERVYGDIAALRPSPDWTAAEAAYRSSMGIAQSQRAELLVCKTALSLAGLLRRLERRREGYELLKGCLERLSEGHDLALIRDCRVLMDELAAAA